MYIMVAPPPPHLTFNQPTSNESLFGAGMTSRLLRYGAGGPLRPAGVAQYFGSEGMLGGGLGGGSGVGQDGWHTRQWRMHSRLLFKDPGMVHLLAI